MPESPGKLFISYSSKDQTDVNKLFSALAMQEIEAWDYSDPEHDLALARQLKASLREKIDSCQYFIAVVSPNSLDEEIGKYPHFEVRYAVESGRFQPGGILPVLINAPAPEESWTGAYSKLKELKHIKLDLLDEEKFERSIDAICNWLSKKYMPSPILTDTVFLIRKSAKELEKIQLSNKEKNTPLPAGQFKELMNLLNECAKQAALGQWEQVKLGILWFLGKLKKIDPEAQIYHPIIIKAGCEFNLKQYENAEKTYLEATTTLSNNSLNWLGYAGLGHARASMHRFDEAIEAFEQALAFGARRDAERRETDLDDIKINLLGAILQSETERLDEALLNKYDFETVLNKYDRSELSPAERRNFFTIKGMFYYKTGNYEVAEQAFQELGLDNLDETAAIYYSLALGELGKDSEAVKILESYIADKLETADKSNIAALYYYLTGAYFRIDEIEKGLKIYKDVLCNPSPANRDYWSRKFFICYALTLKAFDDEKYKKEIHSICEKVLDGKFFPSPMTKEEYYYTGFANYLLGRDERAKYDFARSEDFSDDYYDKLNL
ncbi:MAG TPA: TIR domain-containing protein [Pyrinomonadaceae bacterium]|jgi:tetratricopeptide (TPR) repeat protein